MSTLLSSDVIVILLSLVLLLLLLLLSMIQTTYLSTIGIIIYLSIINTISIIHC